MRKNSSTANMNVEDSANAVTKELASDPPDQNGTISASKADVKEKDGLNNAAQETRQLPSGSIPPKNAPPQGAPAPPGFQGLSISDKEEKKDSIYLEIQPHIL